MKKAIIAVPYLKGMGGTETVIKNFAEALDVKKIDNDISWKLISFGGSDKSDWLKDWNKKVYNFSKMRDIQLVAYATIMPFLIASILKKEKPDFFIATNPIIWSIAYKFKKSVSPNTKIIAWYHYSFKMKRIKPKYLQRADEFWAISTGIEKELVSLGVSKTKIRVIFNPINVQSTSYVKRSSNNNHYIYIGRIDYDGQKNVAELIHALAKVEGNWTCDLYGSVDDNTKIKLYRLAKKNKIDNKIHFKGFYSNVWKKINNGDILVLTSKFEGLPMVLCEAAAHGLFLVAANCPTGVADIVDPKKNGRLYKPGNYLELASILNEIEEGKIKINSQSDIVNSVNKFGYKSYKSRIIDSLQKLERMN